MSDSNGLGDVTTDGQGIDRLRSFAIEEGVRSLEHQQSERDRIRDRSRSLLAISGGLTTFVVDAIVDSLASKDTEFFWFMAGITTFFGLQVLVMLYLSRATVASRNKDELLTKLFGFTPLGTWTQKAEASLLMSIANNSDYTVNERFAHLAAELDDARRDNEAILDVMRRGLASATGLSIALIALLIAALWRLG